MDIRGRFHVTRLVQHSRLNLAGDSNESRCYRMRSTFVTSLVIDKYVYKLHMFIYVHTSMYHMRIPVSLSSQTHRHIPALSSGEVTPPTPTSNRIQLCRNAL